MILISFQLALPRELCDTLKKHLQVVCQQFLSHIFQKKITADDNE